MPCFLLSVRLVYYAFILNLTAHLLLDTLEDAVAPLEQYYCTVFLGSKIVCNVMVKLFVFFKSKCTPVPVGQEEFTGTKRNERTLSISGLRTTVTLTH